MKPLFSSRIVFAAVVYAGLFLPVFVSADEVDNFVRSKMSERHIPGVAVAVVKGGAVIKRAGYGFASVEFDAPVTPGTVFEIGSVSKQITAAGIMLLVEDGSIKLDEKVSMYLDTPDLWADVTVRHLLTHTSGIKSYTRIGGFELSNRYDAEAFIGELSEVPLEFEPGAEYRFSNSGYNLLGYIIESVSGDSYWEFLRERILLPLNMNQTADRDPQFIIKGRASGYEWKVDRLTGRDYDLTDLFSSGAIVSSADDLAKWVIALRGGSLLKTVSREEMWKPFTLTGGSKTKYGFGWNIENFRKQRAVRHSGSTAGFSANVSKFMNADLSIVVLTNLGTQGIGNEIALGIAKIYIPSLSLKTLRPSPKSQPRATRLITTFLNDVLRNRLNSNALTNDLFVELSSERSMANNRRILSFGRITKTDLIDMRFSGETRIYRYRVKTEKRLMLWRFAINSAGKISSISLLEEE